MRLTDIFRKVESTSVEDTKRMLSERREGEMELVDVREPREYEEGHIPGARLIPLSELPDKVNTLRDSQSIVTYCRRGPRSRSAAALLKGKGFEKVYSLEGGIDAWNGIVARGEYEQGMFLLEGMKTTEELVSLAWGLEEGARLFYEQARDLFPDDDFAGVFDSLVKAEQRHKSHIFGVYRKIKGAKSTDEIMVKESITGSIEGGISIEEALEWLKVRGRSSRDVLEFSMQMETNSLDLYMKMEREINMEEAKKIFRTLIEEEKRHLSRLGELLERSMNT